MKKWLLILLFVPNFVFAIDESCFYNVWSIPTPDGNTIKVISDTNELYFYQKNKLLNSKLFKDYQKKNINYNIINTETLTISWNTIHFDQYNTKKEIIIAFPYTLIKNTFNYEINTNSSWYVFEISKDGKNYFKIDNNLTHYDIDYVKISFPNTWSIKNISIFSLNFFNYWNYEFLVNSHWNDTITVYSEYLCNNETLNNEINEQYKTQYFPIDIHTKSYHVKMLQNPIFNSNYLTEFQSIDTDKDSIVDISDNCPKDYNPTQLDSNASWLWDACDDKDNDTIIGKWDNCPTIYNPDQKDINKNWIWDACEIDNDKDSIFDTEDNCPTQSNPNQKDTDWDKIGDTCDNCPYLYNSDQKNIDWDKQWDICDKKDDRFIESNKLFFISITLFIAMIFITWIVIMIKKVAKLNK